MQPPLSDKPLAELHAIRAHLLRQFRRTPPELIAGSLAEIHVKCGRAGCHCATGERHAKHLLTTKITGRTRTTYIPQELLPEVCRWRENYQRAKQLLKELSDVNEAILRGHGRRQRAERQRADGFRLVGDDT